MGIGLSGGDRNWVTDVQTAGQDKRGELRGGGPSHRGYRAAPPCGTPLRSAHEVSLDLLRLIQTSPTLAELVRAAVVFFKMESGCEAVGIRLNDGVEYPYFQAQGFKGDFIALENNICTRDADGEVLRDDSGRVLLDCVCGTVIRGETDPGQPFYTERGSFWTNHTTGMAFEFTGFLPDHIRGRCVGEGYQSVALIPLAVGQERIGLLQLNDHRQDVFNAEGIALWEEFADHLALAISRLKAEEDKRRSEQHYRTLFESAADMVIVLDATGRVLDVNQAGCDFLGYGCEELLGTHAAELHAKDAANTFRETFNDILAHGTGMFVTLLQPKTGQSIPAEISGRLIEAEGTPQVLAVVRDLRQRMRAEAELREKQEELNRFFGLDAGLLCIADTSGYFRRLSAGWEKVLGYTLDELTSRPYLEFVHPDDRLPTVGVADLLERQEEISEFVNRYITKDGEVRWIEWRCVAVGELIYGTARDVSEQQEADRELHRLNRALVALNQSSQALVRATDEQALLLEMCDIIVAIGGYDLAWVGMVEQGDTIVVSPVAWSGDAAGYLDTARFEYALGEDRLPAAAAVTTGRTQVVEDVEHAHVPLPSIDFLRRLGLRSVVAIPLRDRDHVFGILAIDSREPNVFKADEKALLEELASGLAYGVTMLRSNRERERAESDRLRAEEDLRISVEQVERGLEGTVMALASALESRDAYTAGHQRRVAELAEAIAAEMGLPRDRVHGLYLAATLHDIGKIQVPAQILSKPGSLTDIERAIIRTHPEAGYQILKNVEFPWPIATMVLQHHERLDGSGYPDGLRDNEISLEARILAVADAVEARTSHRPYRPAGDEEGMWEELTGRFAGEFDQAVVTACRTVWPALRARQKQV